MAKISEKGMKWIKTGGAIAVILGAVWYVQNKNPEWLQRATGGVTQMISGVDIPNSSINPTGEEPITQWAAAPDRVRAEGVGQWRHQGIPWNGQIGLIYANGGAQTASGSQMANAGLNVNIARQDMYDVMQAELMKFAIAFSEGDSDPTVGVHSVTIMGDAGASFLAGLQPQLDRYNLHARIIGATGRSYGEDKCMGKPEWADNPQSARGGRIAAVMRDGDYNICLVWAQTNGVPVNPDETTYDPDALNFYGVDSFTAADAAFIAGFSEDLTVVSEGRPTGESRRVTIEGTATWTPGDVNVMTQLAEMGSPKQVVSLLSTRENGAQMFSTIIVIDEWAMENPNTVTNFLQAALNGSAIVANDRGELRNAAAMSAQVWGEQDADYWERYYYGELRETPNSGGRPFYFGGSQALGLASNAQYFLPAGNSVYDRVYQSFGDMYQELYPDLMPEYPKDVINPYFLQRIQSIAGGSAGSGAVFGTFDGGETQQVANRSYAIQFAQGSATILPSSLADLNSILNNVTIGSNLAIVVEGHTSSEGSDATNQTLSEARARAVRDWLVQNAPSGLITPERISVVGKGETQLVTGPNGAENAAASRRVEIGLRSQ